MLACWLLHVLGRFKWPSLVISNASFRRAPHTGTHIHKMLSNCATVATLRCQLAVASWRFNKLVLKCFLSFIIAYRLCICICVCIHDIERALIAAEFNIFCFKFALLLLLFSLLLLCALSPFMFMLRIAILFTP